MPSVAVAATLRSPATTFVGGRAHRRKLLAQKGASVTIVSAEKRANVGAEFEPSSHRLAGRRLEVVGSEAGQPLLSDGSTFSAGPEKEWSYADGLAIQTTATTRTAYKLAPPAAVKAFEPAVPGDESDESEVEVASHNERSAVHDEERRARAAAEFEAAVLASIAASQLRPAEAFAVFSDMQDGRKLASRMWDGAFRPGDSSDSEWGEQRDHVDGGVALTLAETENTAWIAKFEGAQRHLLGRIASEKTAGRGAVGEAEHEYELRLTLRGLVADGRVLAERRSRLARA